MSVSIYDFNVKTISGGEVSLSEYKDKVILIVNTASKCGYTPQYEGLESLYRDFSSNGLVILGFPCNQFGKQEQGSDIEIQTFCQLNYAVSFPMFAKIDVNGAKTLPLYQYLKENARGVLGSKSIKWNFTKFLVNRDGKVVERFAPKETPEAIKTKIQPYLIEPINDV